MRNCFLFVSAGSNHSTGARNEPVNSKATGRFKYTVVDLFN